MKNVIDLIERGKGERLMGKLLCIYQFLRSRIKLRLKIRVGMLLLHSYNPEVWNKTNETKQNETRMPLCSFLGVKIL